MRLAAVSSVTSAAIVTTPSRARTESSASTSRATTVTFALRATSASTSPRPSPRLPPVTTTRLSLRLIVLLLFQLPVCKQDDRGSEKESGSGPMCTLSSAGDQLQPRRSVERTHQQVHRDHSAQR